MAAEAVAASQEMPDNPTIDIDPELLKPQFEAHVTVDLLTYGAEDGWRYAAKDILEGTVVSGPEPEAHVYVLPRPDHPNVQHDTFPSLHPRQFPHGPFLHDETATWLCLVFSPLTARPAA